MSPLKCAFHLTAAVTPRKYTQGNTFSWTLQKHVHIPNHSLKQHICNVPKTRPIPKAGVPVLAKSDHVQLRSFLLWKMSVCTSVGWWLQEPCLACRGHGSALSFNEKPPQRWVNPALQLLTPASGKGRNLQKHQFPEGTPGSQTLLPSQRNTCCYPQYHPNVPFAPQCLPPKAWTQRLQLMHKCFSGLIRFWSWEQVPTGAEMP